MVVLDRNWRCDAGEIDLVLRDGDGPRVSARSRPGAAPVSARPEAVTAARPHGCAARRPLDGAAGCVRPTCASTWSACCPGPGRRLGRPRARGGLMGSPPRARSRSRRGHGHLIDVQVDVSAGLVATAMVGRPDASISEARDRCRAALTNSRLRLAGDPADHDPAVAGRPAQARPALRPRHRRRGARGGRTLRVRTTGEVEGPPP